MTGPATIDDGATLPVSIDSWEIGCCAPEPEVGRPARWGLIFRPPAAEPEFNGTADWAVSPWEPADSRQHYLLLRHGDLTAVWPNAPDLPSGVHRLTGRLIGTAHGGPDRDGGPSVGTVVRRVRVISQQVTITHQAIVRVPGTFTFRDAERSPKWFTHLPMIDGGSGEVQRGVLIDLAVRRDG